jgi:hypothetical protein
VRLRQDYKIYKFAQILLIVFLQELPDLHDGRITRMRKVGRLVSSTTRKFLSRPDEALLLCRMAWWVAVVSVTARCYSLPRALQIVAGRENRKPSGQATSQDELARAIDQLLSVDIFIFKPVCWKRAAVLHRYLSRSGIATRIIFGVRNETSGKFSGHAWLEANGRPILEKAPPQYVVTYSFPSL